MNRNGFVNFICACIPGVGYMYNGLLKKGLELLIIFLLVPVVLDIIGLSSLEAVIMVPLWFYSFFGTYSVVNRQQSGEAIQDESIFLGNKGLNMKNANMKICGFGLILLGTLSILNRILKDMDIWYMVRSYVAPIVFIALGVYILLKNNKSFY